MAGGALFKLDDGGSLAAEQCTFTVRTTDLATSFYTPEAAVFELYTLQNASGGLRRTVREPFQIQMTDCVVRGDAELLRALDAVPLDFTWTNGLFASSDRMFRIGGSSQPARVTELVRIRLQHVTAHARGGLCLLTSDRARPYVLPVDLHLADSIVITRPASYLIEQRGLPSVQACEDQLTFHGERNYYEGMEVFWMLGPQGQMEQPFEFADWRSHWGAAEQSPQYQQVRWRRFPSGDLPLAEHLVSDYLLQESLANPARQSAADRRNAGLDATTLAQVPSEVELESAH
jgi:hypothetical protein